MRAAPQREKAPSWLQPERPQIGRSPSLVRVCRRHLCPQLLAQQMELRGLSRRMRRTTRIPQRVTWRCHRSMYELQVDHASDLRKCCRRCLSYRAAGIAHVQLLSLVHQIQLQELNQVQKSLERIAILDEPGCVSELKFAWNNLKEVSLLDASRAIRRRGCYQSF